MALFSGSPLYRTLASFLSAAFFSSHPVSADTFPKLTLSKKIVDTLFAAEQGKRTAKEKGTIILYDPLFDESPFCDFSSSGVTAILPLPQKEYIIAARRSDALGIVSEDGKTTPIEYLTIYECTIGKKKEVREKGAQEREGRTIPCVNYADYKVFSDDDLDDHCDDLRVKRGRAEYFYDFSRDFMKDVYVVTPGRKGNLDLIEYNTERKRKRTQKEYEQVLYLVAKAYGIK